MSLRTSGINLQRLRKVLSGHLNAILIGPVPTPGRQTVPCIGKSCICLREAGVFSDGHLIILQACHKSLPARVKTLNIICLVQEKPCPEIIIPRLRVCSWKFSCLAGFAFSYNCIKFSRYFPGYFDLETEHVSQFPVISLRPQVSVPMPVNKLDSNSDLIVLSSDTSLEHMPGIYFSRYLT